MFRKKATHFYRHVRKGNLYASFVVLFSRPSLSFILVRLLCTFQRCLFVDLNVPTFKLYSTSVCTAHEKKTKNGTPNWKMSIYNEFYLSRAHVRCQKGQSAFAGCVCVCLCYSLHECRFVGFFSLPFGYFSSFVLVLRFVRNFSSHANRSTLQMKINTFSFVFDSWSKFNTFEHYTFNQRTGQIDVLCAVAVVAVHIAVALHDAESHFPKWINNLLVFFYFSHSFCNRTTCVRVVHSNLWLRFAAWTCTDVCVIFHFGWDRLEGVCIDRPTPTLTRTHIFTNAKFNQD